MINPGTRAGRFAVASAALLVSTLFGSLVAAPATSQASSAYQAQAVNVTNIPANGTVTLKARGFCLDYGKPFPTGSMSPTGLGGDNVRGALNYAIQKGYTDSNAEQVQNAIWYIRDNAWHNADHALAQEIADNSKGGTLPTANGTSLADALSQKSITISAKFVPQSADAFYGDGDVVITNTTGSALSVYMPVGVSFEVPGANGQFQNLLAYELVQATTTPTAGATTTVAATAEATAQSTATNAGAATTEVATATTGTVAQSTATTEVATPEATSTTAAVATEAPTQEPAATSTPTVRSGDLPTTGDGEMGMIALVALMMAVSMIALGFVAKARAKA